MKFTKYQVSLIKTIARTNNATDKIRLAKLLAMSINGKLEG